MNELRPEEGTTMPRYINDPEFFLPAIEDLEEIIDSLREDVARLEKEKEKLEDLITELQERSE